MTTDIHWQHIDTIRPISLTPPRHTWEDARVILHDFLEQTRHDLAESQEQTLHRLWDLVRDAAAAVSRPSPSRGFCGEIDPAETQRRWAEEQEEIAARHPTWRATAPSTAPVIALLMCPQRDGSTLIASIRKDDAEGSGYTIPELVVGSDGVHERGAPHFDRIADAKAWARRAGWRVMIEQEPQRDPLRGDASQPRPSASA